MSTPTLADSLTAATAAVNDAAAQYLALEERVALREAAAVKAAGGTPSDTDTTELARAQARGLFVGSFGAAANSLVATLPGGLVFPTLEAWTRIRGFAPQTNTSPNVTFSVVGYGAAGAPLAGTLLRRDGSALAVGDVPINAAFDVQPDGLGNFRMVAPVSSEVRRLISGACVLAAGTFSIPVPAGANRIWLNECTGGGGAGGTVTVSGTGGAAAGGTGGGRSRGGFFDIKPGVTAITGTVGAAGQPSGSPATNGGNGGATFIDQSCLVQSAPYSQGGVGGPGTGFASGVVGTNFNVATASGGYRNQSSVAASGGYLAGGYYSGGAGSGPGGSSFSTPSSGTNGPGATGAEPGSGGQGGGVTGQGTAYGGAGASGLIDFEFFS